MRKLIAISLALACIGFGSTVLAEPYAAVADLPAEDSEFYGMWKMNLAEVQVPDSSQVHVPAYPGARVVRVNKVGDPDAAGSRKTPKIVMLSTDGRQKVAAFYKQALQGWKQGGDQRSTFFWTDSDVFALGPIAYRDVPSVVLSDPGPMDFMEKSLMSDARTIIKIVYKPAR